MAHQKAAKKITAKPGNLVVLGLFLFFSPEISAKPLRKPSPRPARDLSFVEPKEWKQHDCVDQLGSQNPYRLSGDFDGDGKKDTARLEFSKDGRRYRLLFKTGKGGAEKVLEEATATSDQRKRLGLMVIDPGEIQTACGKGYWKCGKNEVAKFTSKYAVLGAFLCESSSWAYRPKASGFEKLPLTD